MGVIYHLFTLIMHTMTYYVEVRRILIYGSNLPFIHPDYTYYDILCGGAQDF